MTLADDLLQQAKDLLDSDTSKPKQATLKRSISTAYYSLFSLLVDEAATLVVGGGQERKYLRNFVARTISHKSIASVSKSFANNPTDKIRRALAGHEIPGDLADVARTCQDLQERRHEADYDFVRRFTKQQATKLIDRAVKAHQKWKTIKDDEAAKVFLVVLACPPR